MTDTVWETRPLTAAIVSRLQTQTGKAIGKATSPGGAPPYAVVYPIFGAPAEMSLNDSQMLVTPLFQVTSIGDDLDEAQWMQHKARQALLGWTPGITGATRIEMDQENLLAATDLEGPVTSVADRFRLSLS
jgi:hypothetical protein